MKYISNEAKKKWQVYVFFERQIYLQKLNYASKNSIHQVIFAILWLTLYFFPFNQSYFICKWCAITWLKRVQSTVQSTVYIHTHTHKDIYIHRCVKYFNINVSREMKNRRKIKYYLEANLNAIGLWPFIFLYSIHFILSRRFFSCFPECYDVTTTTFLWKYFDIESSEKMKVKWE